MGRAFNHDYWNDQSAKMKQQTTQKEQQDEVTRGTGFVDINIYTMLAAEQYKPNEPEITKFIKKVSKRHTAVKISDIKISNIEGDYKIKIHKDEFNLYFDFKAIDKDVKKWPAIQAHIKQFLKNKVIELAYSYLRVQIKALTEVQKGVTKKPRGMIEAESLTIYDYDTSDALFDYIKEKGQFDEVKKFLENKQLLHLKNNYQYLYDALLYYVHLYRYTKKGTKGNSKYKGKNIRNGKPIVAMASITDDNSDATFGKSLVIQDDWITFCKRAGITNAEDRKELSKELNKGSTIPAIAIGKVGGSNELRSITSFIVCEFVRKPIKKSNLENAKSYISEIIMYVNPMFLDSILDVSAKGHAGYSHFPYPLQAILENVFKNPDKHTKLKDFCSKQGFKRITGNRFQIGYRQIYEEIHAEVSRTAPNYKYNGQDCYLIVFNAKRIKEVAQRVYKGAIRAGGKFQRKESIEYILTGLEVIRLATGDDKDFISIWEVKHTDPAIQIIIKRMSKEKSQALEKLLLSNC